MEENKEFKNNELNEKVFNPSHKMDGKYAILMETNDTEFEQWYYFIRVDNNEENLKHLSDQLDKIDWELLEDSSIFDLEMDYFVSAQTAKEMTKVDLNPTSFHRKFDGKLKKIDFDFRKKDGNSTKICKVFDTLGNGQIEDYISDEDIDEEDLVSGEESSDNESYSSSSSSENENDSPKRKNTKKIPPSLLRERLVEKIKEEQDRRKKGSKQEKINYDE
jgi:hypothetical protein